MNIPIVEIATSDTMVVSTNTESEYLHYNAYRKNDSKSPSLFFDLVLSESEWKSILPESKLYRDKGMKNQTYKSLKVGWTDVIAKAHAFLKINMYLLLVSFVHFA